MVKIAVVDLETTGPNYQAGDRIIQIGAVIIENHQITKRHQMLINPEQNIPSLIKTLTGISDEEVAKAPIFDSVAELWFERLKDCIFVAHQLSFDLEFLNESFQGAGIETFNPLAIDTVQLARIIYPQVTAVNLSTLSEYLGLRFEDAHNALADAEVTAEIMNQMARRVLGWSKTLQDDIHTVSQYLLYETAAFFAQPEDFLIHSQEALAIGQDQAKNSTNITAFYRAYCNYILHELEKPFSKVLKYPKTFIEYELKDALLAYLGQESEALLQPLTYVLPSTQFKAASQDESLKKYCFRRSDDFIHLNQYHQLRQKIYLADLNQSELMTYGSLMVWLESTTTGLIEEMNPDLAVDDLLNTYAKHYSKQNHLYYNRHVDQMKKSKLLFIEMKHCVSLINNQWRSTDFLSNYHFLIDDLGSFNESIHAVFQSQVDLSQWLKDLNQLERELVEGSSSPDLIEGVQELIDCVVDLLEKLESLIENPQLASIPQAQSLTQGLKPEAVAAIESHLRIIDSRLTRSSLSQLKTDQKQGLERMKEDLKLLAVKENNLLSFTCQLIMGQYFHFKLLICKGQLAHSWEQLIKFGQSLNILSANNDRQNLLESHYLGSEIKSIHLAKTENKLAFLLGIPLSYMENSKNLSKAEQNRYLVEGQVDFLTDHFEELPDVIYCVCANRLFVTDLYHQLTQEKILKDSYTIYGQGISGSLTKIKRKSKNDPKKIFLLTYQQLLAEKWQIQANQTLVLLQKLPFKSLDDSYVQRLGQELAIEETALFDCLLLPNLEECLLSLVDYFKYYLKAEQIWLFDDRVYTKYYSSQLRKNLRQSLIFDLLV